MKYIIIVTFATLILLTPLRTSIKIFYSNQLNKTFFTINIFKFIKIKSGYISFIKDGIAIHLSEDKAVIIPYKNLINTKKVIKLYKDFHVNDLSVLVEIGAKDDLEKILTISTIYNFIFNNITEIIKERKPYSSINSKINISIESNYFNLYIYGKIFINLITILINAIKIIMENIINAKRKSKRKQIYQDN